MFTNGSLYEHFTEFEFTELPTSFFMADVVYRYFGLCIQLSTQLFYNKKIPIYTITYTSSSFKI